MRSTSDHILLYVIDFMSLAYVTGRRCDRKPANGIEIAATLSEIDSSSKREPQIVT
jgi:hypothetical protein